MHLANRIDASWLEGLKVPGVEIESMKACDKVTIVPHTLSY